MRIASRVSLLHGVGLGSVVGITADPTNGLPLYIVRWDSGERSTHYAHELQEHGLDAEPA